MTKTSLTLALVASLAAIAVYAAPGGGYGPGYGAGTCATAGAESTCPGGGNGQGGGRMMGGHGAAGAGPMMTEDERAAHREKMHSFTTVEQCNAYWTEHRAQMTERAKAQGIEPGPGPRTSPCERMAQRGMLQR